jgi:hypothetical protein
LIVTEDLCEQPDFGGCCLDVSEVDGELVGSAFEFFIQAFDGVPIRVCFVLESESVAATGFLEPLRPINENHGVDESNALVRPSEISSISEDV